MSRSELAMLREAYGPYWPGSGTRLARQERDQALADALAARTRRPEREAAPAATATAEVIDLTCYECEAQAERDARARVLWERVNRLLA